MLVFKKDFFYDGIKGFKRKLRREWFFYYDLMYFNIDLCIIESYFFFRFIIDIILFYFVINILVRINFKD